MNILYIAPQPFYIDRGTPIDVKLTLDVLDQRGHAIDMVTFGEGRDLPYRNVTYHRAPRIEALGHVKPGFSLKKIFYDLLMIGTIARLVRSKRYDLIYTVEEGVFFAMALKKVLKIPYVYDMDSSMSDQMIEKYSFLRPLKQTFLWFERKAASGALAVVPVCDALGKRARAHGASKVEVLYDIPIHATEAGQADDLREMLGPDGPIVMYVGNLEVYQGIGLLLESAALLPADQHFYIVVIGGADDDIIKYREKARDLNIADRVDLIGRRPVEDIYGYLEQADILVSPRTKGANTPMKIYSYLSSGKPLLATRLWTHTQVLSEKDAMLADPNPQAFAEGLRSLLEDESLRKRVGEAGRRLIDTKHNHARYVETFNECLDWLEQEITGTSFSLETTA